MRRFAIILTVALLSVACNRDPNVVKLKYLQAGDRYFLKQKYREASLMYRSAIRKDLRYGDAYFRNAAALIRLGQLSGAEASLRRAVELLPEGSERLRARVQLADIYVGYLESGRFDRHVAEEADRLCKDILSFDAKSFDALRLRGAVAVMKAVDLSGKYPTESAEELRKAIADLRAADAMKPFQPEVVSSLTRALWGGKQPEEAEKYLQNLLRAKPTFAKSYEELSRFYRKNNRMKEAEELLLRASATLPQQTQFVSELAELYQALGRNTDMAKTLDRLKSQEKESSSAYEFAGKLYMRAAQPEQAIHEFAEGMRRFPSFKAAFQNLTMSALMAQNKNAEARKLNDEILHDNPHDGDASARKAQYALEDGNSNQAIAILTETLQRTPNHPLAHYNLGRAHVAIGQPERARYEFSEAIRWAPEFLPARIELIKIHIAAGEYGPAVASADEVLAAETQQIEAKLLRVIALRGLRKFEDARTAIQALLASNPEYDEALFQLGAIEQDFGRLNESEAAYLKSYRINPNNSSALVALADLKFRRGQGDQALEMLRSEVKKRPDRFDLRLVLGSMAARAGRREEAAAEFKTLLDKPGQNPRGLAGVNLRLGLLYFEGGQIPESIPYFEKARQYAPTDPRILHSLGVAYDVTGRKKEASDLYAASLKVDNQNPVAMNNLAYYISENGGDLDQALNFAQKARQSMPAQLGFSDTVACIYLKKNLVDSAIEILEEVVSKSPQDPAFRLHLGEALLKKGKTDRAKKELQVALSSKPSSEDATKIKELLRKI